MEKNDREMFLRKRILIEMVKIIVAQFAFAFFAWLGVTLFLGALFPLYHFVKYFSFKLIVKLLCGALCCGIALAISFVTQIFYERIRYDRNRIYEIRRRIREGE